MYVIFKSLLIFLFIYSKCFSKDINYIYDVRTFASKKKVNVVIEIPKNTKEKWEVSKINGKIEPDYFMGKPRIIENYLYPENYGFIPRTVMPIKEGGDGDPLDAIVIGEELKRGDIVKVEVIGGLVMNDFGENDYKIITVLDNKDKKLSIRPEKVDEKIKLLINFFKNYKEYGFVEIDGFQKKKDAIKYIEVASKFFEIYGVNPR